MNSGSTLDGPLKPGQRQEDDDDDDDDEEEEEDGHDRDCDGIKADDNDGNKADDNDEVQRTFRYYTG